MRHGNSHLGAKINAMQEAGRLETTIEADEKQENSDSNDDVGGRQLINEPIRHAARTDRPETAGKISVLFDMEDKSRFTEEVTV